MPTKRGTFTFTLPIKIIECRDNVSLAVVVNKAFSDNELDIIEINHHDVKYVQPVTEQKLQPETLFTAEVSILNGRGHALTLKPFTKSHATTTEVE